MLMAVQDIQAEEAMKDWKDRRTEEIQRLKDAVDRDQEELNILKAQLSELGDDYDDWSDGEKEEERVLNRRSRRVRLVLENHMHLSADEANLYSALMEQHEFE